jgi:signal transduction histidine kinase
VNASGSKEVAFMGKVTAGATHELKNVLAIIRESAGLMQDLMALSGDASFPLRDKFSRVLSNIGDQVTRGVDITGRLNTFAHLPDETMSGLDLNEVAEQVVCLSQRFARLRGISVSVQPQERSVIIVTSPLKIQMLLFQCVETLVNVAGTGTVLTVRPFQQAEGEATVELSSAGKNETAGDKAVDLAAMPGWVELQESALSLNGSIEPGNPPVWLSIKFGHAAR